MAELNQKSDPTTTKKIRVRKIAPKVDLTAMVDLAFLLITFFMLTTTLNKPHSLDVALPDKQQSVPQDMDERRVISLLVSEGKVGWYQGDFNKPLLAPETLDIGTDALRTILTKMKTNIPNLAEGKDMVVLIKPSKDARTLDIIKTLDEMKIVGVKRYLISKISMEEEGYMSL